MQILSSLWLAIFLLFGASYEKDSGSTSSIIKDADVDVYIVESTDNYHKVKFDYELKVGWQKFKGSETKKLDKYLFTSQFLRDLRGQKHMKLEEFSLQHLHYNGTCDTALAYDFKDTSPLDDVKARITFCEGLPLLQIDTIRAKGKVRGSKVKLGLNLKR